jgi:hypothetical protein
VPLAGRLRVRAAPWIDVTSVEIIAGIPAPPPAAGAAATQVGTTKVVFKENVPSRPMTLGKEEGTLEEAAARTVRFETDLTLTLPEGTRWIVLQVRGERLLDDVLPFMPIQPFAFTNPIWIAH